MKGLSQPERAAYFRQLHEQRPLVLPNAWDAASARVIELAGAAAIATTSAGVSWTYGRGDGQKLLREEMLQVVRRIVESVDVPVTADIEGGYGTGSPQDVATTVRGVIAAGAVGINLEDSPGPDGEALLSPQAQAERIRAARDAARATDGDIVINARTDVYLLRVGAPDMWFERPSSERTPTVRLEPTACSCQASSTLQQSPRWYARSTARSTSWLGPTRRTCRNSGSSASPV